MARVTRLLPFRENGAGDEAGYRNLRSREASLLRGLQELDDGPLFLASNVGSETHVVNNDVPLRVGIHRGRPNVVAAQTVVRPKLFAAETHIGIVRDRVARMRRFGKQVRGRAGEENKQSREQTAIQCCHQRDSLA